MLEKIVEILFGCRHRNYSFPVTLKTARRVRRPGPAGMYVVCLDCGSELPYDWSRMRVAARRSDRNRGGSAPRREQPAVQA